MEGARDLIVGVFIEQLLESLGIELAARHAKLARPFLSSLKEWGRNRDGCLHSLSITQLYRLRRPGNRVPPIDPLAQDLSQMSYQTTAIRPYLGRRVPANTCHARADFATRLRTM